MDLGRSSIPKEIRPRAGGGGGGGRRGRGGDEEGVGGNFHFYERTELLTDTAGENVGLLFRAGV